MKKETAPAISEQLALMTSWAEGKIKIEEIERRHKSESFNDEWRAFKTEEIPLLDFDRFYFRRKPQLRRWWVNIYPNRKPEFHNNREDADKYALMLERSECIEVQEVIK